MAPAGAVDAFLVEPWPVPAAWAQAAGAGAVLGCSGVPGPDDFLRAGVARPDGLDRAVTKRWREFLAGRLAATAALRALGWTGEVDLSAGEDRLPRWPAGIHGSISHSGPVAVGWVASELDCGGVGVDVEAVMAPERSQRLRPRIAPELSTPPCDGAGSGWPDLPPTTLTTLAFSAKESLFKALYPSVRRYLGFDAAQLVGMAPDGSSLRLRLSFDWSAAWPEGTELTALASVDEVGGRVMTLLQLPSVK